MYSNFIQCKIAVLGLKRQGAGDKCYNFAPCLLGSKVDVYGDCLCFPGRFVLSLMVGLATVQNLGVRQQNIVPNHLV